MSIKSKFSANEVKILNFGINKIITQVMIQTLAKMLKNKSRGEVPKFVLYFLVPSLLLFIVLLLFRPFLFLLLFFLLILHSHSFSPTLSRPLLPLLPSLPFPFLPSSSSLLFLFFLLLTPPISLTLHFGNHSRAILGLNNAPYGPLSHTS